MAEIDTTETTPSLTQKREKASLPDSPILLGWLRQMMLIREFEVRTMQAYQNRQIGGFCHMLEVGDRLQDGIAVLNERKIETNQVLEELVLYIGRIAAWLDLHICWWPMNEMTRNAQEGRLLSTNIK